MGFSILFFFNNYINILLFFAFKSRAKLVSTFDFLDLLSSTKVSPTVRFCLFLIVKNTIIEEKEEVKEFTVNCFYYLIAKNTIYIDIYVCVETIIDED